MGFHFPRIATIFWLLLFLDYAAAVSQILSPSVYSPDPSVWTTTTGQYVSLQPGDETYVDFEFNWNGEEYVSLSVNAYGYIGTWTSWVPAPYTIQIDGVDHTYGAGQQQPVVFDVNPTFTYRVLVWAESPANGVVVNSVVVSRPDPPSSSTPTHSTTSSLPPSSAVAASTTQASSSAASSLSPSSHTSLLTSAGTSASITVSTGTGNATSTERQPLGVPVLLTVSGSVITQESQPTALLSSSSSSSSSPSLGVVIGPIAGTIVIMILAVIIYLRRRYRAREKGEQDEVGSYFGEEESQHRPTSEEPDMVEQSDTVGQPSIISEKSRYPYQFFDRRTPSRYTASATAHVSFITSVTGSSSGSRAYGGIEGSNSDPFTSTSRISMSSIGAEAIAPPAYVEEESNASPRTERS